MLGRGYGFIRPAVAGPDVFFHQTGLANRTLDTLEEGAVCSYDVEEGPKGSRAIRIYVA